MGSVQKPSFQYQKGWPIESVYRIWEISTLTEAPRILEGFVTDYFILSAGSMLNKITKKSLSLVWHYLPILS